MTVPTPCSVWHDATSMKVFISYVYLDIIIQCLFTTLLYAISSNLITLYGCIYIYILCFTTISWNIKFGYIPICSMYLIKLNKTTVCMWCLTTAICYQQGYYSQWSSVATVYFLPSFGRVMGRGRAGGFIVSTLDSNHSNIYWGGIVLVLFCFKYYLINRLTRSCHCYLRHSTFTFVTPLYTGYNDACISSDIGIKNNDGWVIMCPVKCYDLSMPEWRKIHVCKKGYL